MFIGRHPLRKPSAVLNAPNIISDGKNMQVSLHTSDKDAVVEAECLYVSPVDVRGRPLRIENKQSASFLTSAFTYYMQDGETNICE